jgi:F-type H+-transporting ATPase subunit epsilon
MIKVDLITPERVVLETSGDAVLVPTTSGLLGIRKGHIPLVAPLTSGELIVRDKSGDHRYAIYGGFVEVLPDRVRILADSAIHSDSLNEAAIEQAIEQARHTRESLADGFQLDSLTAHIEANLSHLKIAQRRRSHGHHRSPIEESSN